MPDEIQNLPPMRRDHERLSRNALEILQPMSQIVTPGDEGLVEERADELLHALRSAGIPSWYAAPILARALAKLLEFNLEVSEQKRMDGQINPADPDVA